MADTLTGSGPNLLCARTRESPKGYIPALLCLPLLSIGSAASKFMLKVDGFGTGVALTRKEARYSPKSKADIGLSLAHTRASAGFDLCHQLRNRLLSEPRCASHQLLIEVRV